MRDRAVRLWQINFRRMRMDSKYDFFLFLLNGLMEIAREKIVRPASQVLCEIFILIMFDVRAFRYFRFGHLWQRAQCHKYYTLHIIYRIPIEPIGVVMFAN